MPLPSHNAPAKPTDYRLSRGELLISLIIPHLGNPTPRPLSRPPRSALKQPGLVSVTRTCKRAHSEAEPYLYKDIATDDICSLLRDITPEAIAANTETSKARRRQLAHTKSLFIEYLPKGVSPRPTYEVILGFSDEDWAEYGEEYWEYCGLERDQLWWWTMRECKVEVDELLDLFQQLRRTTLSASLPLLEKVCISSIYGAETVNIWESYNNWQNTADGSQPPSFYCAQSFHAYFATGHLHCLCIRDIHGPLAMPNLDCDIGCGPVSGPFPYRLIAHFQGPAWELPLPIGSPIRWMYESTPDQDWATSIRHIGWRLESEAGSGRLGPSSFPGRPELLLDLTISCSTDRCSPQTRNPHPALFPTLVATGLTPPRDFHTAGWHIASPLTKDYRVLSVQEQREWACGLEHAVMDALERVMPAEYASSHVDRAVWQCAADSPPCEACGSTPVI